MITTPVLVDTGPLVTIFYKKEQHHERCVEEAKYLPEPLYTCWPVITEAAYLLRVSRAGVAALLSEVARGRLEILPLSSSDVGPVQEIIDRFGDQYLDLADACLMHLAEREGFGYIFTLDRRHFSVLRTSRGEAVEILPA